MLISYHISSNELNRLSVELSELIVYLFGNEGYESVFKKDRFSEWILLFRVVEELIKRK